MGFLIIISAILSSVGVAKFIEDTNSDPEKIENKKKWQPTLFGLIYVAIWMFYNSNYLYKDIENEASNLRRMLKNKQYQQVDEALFQIAKGNHYYIDEGELSETGVELN